MRESVLDASVILTLLNQERGHENVKHLLPDAVMSTVNVAEIAGILLVRHKLPLEQIHDVLAKLISAVIEFDEQQAYISAELESVNRENKYNLSLADRACIALGVAINAPIYTTDTLWAKVRFKNAEVVLLR